MSGFAEGTPTVTVTLDKPRTLGFTLGAMRRAKELGVLSVNVDSETDFLLALPQFVWASLSEADRNELSVDAISELIHPRNMGEVAEAMVSLFKGSMPKEKPDPNASPVAVKEPTTGNRTSINSGVLESTISV